ncbi:hypothetical protein LUZ62_032695 [Rhynchospora pubera]|uniref:Btz domain-containing protein n=1 Tax=Rhynchospora pubera TaxID=906938 RepID=A0AAV8HRB3_9POAL|nr:hypothetical protein LUZ62_032695 [Rhynchospora pubera]
MLPSLRDRLGMRGRLNWTYPFLPKFSVLVLSFRNQTLIRLSSVQFLRAESPMAGREERKREMDRTDDRDSHFRRRHSRRERTPSPKRLRRDRESERERDERRHRDLGRFDKNNSRETERSREVKSAEVKGSIDGLKDSSGTKDNGPSDVDRLNSDPKEFARSKIYLQHDDRGSSGQVVQIHIRHDADKTRSNLKEHRSGEKSNVKTEIEMKHTSKKKADSGWDHDRFVQPDLDLLSEKKRPVEPELGLKTPNAEHKSSDFANIDKKKNDTRDDRFSRRDDRVVSRENLPRSWRVDRFTRREGGFNRGNGTGNGNGVQRNDFRDRFRGRGPPRGRDRYNGPRLRDGHQQQQTSGAQTDKWKHDKYEEANQSLNNEEDQIAKVEALLAL